LVAKELLMGNEPEKWVKRVTKGIVTPVYLGRTNGHVFLTVTGIGFDSLVVNNVTEESKRLFNKMAYAVQGAELMRKELAFSDWRYKFQVRFDDEEEWHEAASVIVGKSRYYAGRYSLFNGASLSNPMLHVALFTGNTRNDFMRYAACIAMEALDLEKSIVLKTAKKLEIRCNEENFAAELDGDAVTTAPLTIELEETPIKFLA
jgi:diacylglycerol kinase family enzyme